MVVKLPYSWQINIFFVKCKQNEIVLVARPSVTNQTFVYNEWVGCRGSRPQFRGYPCSLWQLFHSLTVGAMLRDQDDPHSPELVSEAIKSYVQEYFTCRHCADNFANETSHLEVEDFEGRKDRAVIWLWAIHNLVNARLSGKLNRKI